MYYYIHDTAVEIILENIEKKSLLTNLQYANKLSVLVARSCNSSAKPPAPIKVVIAGGDSFVNTVLRHYVDLLSFRPPDWQNYLRFLIVPLGFNNLSKYLSSIDARYSMLFGDEWRELVEREGASASESANRVTEFIATTASTLLLPIAEAMVTYRLVYIWSGNYL